MSHIFWEQCSMNIKFNAKQILNNRNKISEILTEISHSLFIMTKDVDQNFDVSLGFREFQDNNFSNMSICEPYISNVQTWCGVETCTSGAT